MVVSDSYQDEFAVRVVRGSMSLWRICASDGSDQHALLEDFRSNYEKRRSKARKLDAHATVIQMALSMWTDPDHATKLSRGLPRQLGGHIARLEIQPGNGVCVAETGSRSHRSVWGRPLQLAAFVADVWRA